ncbi:MAG: hypothetical protein M3076_15980 [Actinomycetota bacterium]|nr:hypothetical protein [Actinomycetota bacterium]
MGSTSSPRRLAAVTVLGFAALAVCAGGALASGPPSRSKLKALGSSPKEARTQPFVGLGAAPSSQPLIAVSFVGGRATVIGGSAVPANVSKHVQNANVPVSAVQCSVNFTTRKIRIGSGSTSVRWFSGIACSRTVELFGQAFLAQSASKFAGSGQYYKGQLKTASSGRAATIVKAANPSLYVWSATNVFFQEKPSRGVIVVQPSANQQINPATSCEPVRSRSFGWGVHCDMYTSRF